jgi:stage V sporulation protein D (sporulation-specific penicillin-binding protein)
VAAPVFREIAEQILPELSVTPDVETKTAPQLIAENRKPSPQEIQDDQQRAATLPTIAKNFSSSSREVIFAPATKRGALMPDVRGQSVRDVMRLCAQLGLNLEAKGAGKAVRQSPSAGAELGSGQTVRVEFERRN